MPGTYVARGDVGRGFKFAGRTRESIGKNTGLKNRLFILRQRFERNTFNFRTINAPDASRVYCYMHRIIIYYGERRQFRFETRPLRVNHFICLYAYFIFKCIIIYTYA